MKIKKGLALILAICSMATFASCGFDEDSSSNGGVKNVYNVESKTKTKLQVIHFDGGVGHIWLDQAAERFAKQYKDKVYAKGKTGIWVDFTNTMTIDTATMSQQDYDVYICERFTTPNALAQGGSVLPLDDIVKDETREGGSLESKLFEQVKGGMKGNDGKYYGLPHYESYGGFSYLTQTFDECLAYFAAEDETNIEEFPSAYGTANFVSTLEAKRSNGPDGKPDTEDDGMPCSIEELIILMDYFKQTTPYAPIALSGSCDNYINYTISGLWASLAGAEQMRNYYNCEGEIEIVDGYYDEPLFKGIDYIKKPKTKKVQLNGSNGYLGNDMVAKYYALALFEIIQKEGFYCDDAYISTRSHYDGQFNIYLGGTGIYKKAAILVEASYWHNEAKKAKCFDQYELLKQASADNLDFCFMPLPTNYYTEGATGKDSCFLDISQTFTVINGNLKNNDEEREAAKDFVRFLYSESELKAFTVETGIGRAIDYDLSAEEEAKLPTFYRRIWNSRDNNAGSNLIMLSGTTSAFRQVWSSINIHLSSDTLSPYAKNSSPFSHFRKQDWDDKSGMYVYGTKTVFDELKITKDEWAKIYREE
ncbi:MAG: extracellular solute-binding protein [Clostridia bacterium]|nr:extracellular solute-binding protein [Clostridia bacterium]